MGVLIYKERAKGLMYMGESNQAKNSRLQNKFLYGVVAGWPDGALTRTSGIGVTEGRIGYTSIIRRANADKGEGDKGTAIILIRSYSISKR